MELDMLFHNLPRDKNLLFGDDPKGNFIAIQPLETFQRVHKDFRPKGSDIYISTYPKNGTTWTVALTDHLLKLKNANHKTPEGIAVGFNLSSCPWIEFLAKIDELWPVSLEYFSEMAEPRVFKTHSTEALIPENVGYRKRIIQVMRNPLDTFVSSWHHIYGKYGYQGSFDRFFEKVVLTDSFESGSWFEYHEEFFNASEEGKIEVLFLKYEDMKIDDGIDAVSKIAEFIDLGCEFDAGKIADMCNFKKMKAISNKSGIASIKTIQVKQEVEGLKLAEIDPGTKNKPSNAHIRKGIVGDWKNYYNVEQLEQWAKYVDEACLKYPKTLEVFGRDYFMGVI